MKSIIKCAGVIVFIAVLGFSFIACSDDNNDDDAKITPITYKGSSSEGEFGPVAYVLTITGDNYVLTKTGVFVYKSTGTVIKKEGTTYYLKPSVTATLFTATVTSSGLKELLGTIIWDNQFDLIPDNLPGQLSPTGSSGGGSGGGGSGGTDIPVGPSGPDGGSGGDVNNPGGPSGPGGEVDIPTAE
jgi:hypothetical protein